MEPGKCYSEEKKTVIFIGHDLTQPASLFFLFKNNHFKMINVCLKPPVLLPAVKCGTLCMSGFVGGCAPTSSKRQFPILYTVGSLFREAVPLEEMCYRMRPSPLPGGKASLLLRKGSETLREVPEQESCWVSGSLILSFFVRHENKEDGVFESRWDY